MRCRRSDAVAVLVPLWLLAVPVSAEPPPPDGSFARYEGVFQLPIGRAIVLTTTGVIAELAKPVFIDWDAYRAGQLVVAAEDSLVSPAVGDPQAACQAEFSIERSADGGAAAVTVRAADLEERRAVAAVFWHDRDVTIPGDGVHLAATLRLPAAAGSFPAVVLVHGSGPGERSYFAVMSSYFASLGMAVLTYDKRGCGGSSGDWREVDLDVLAQDALAAVTWLATRPEIDPRRVGLWGISQGGWITPLAASLYAKQQIGDPAWFFHMNPDHDALAPYRRLRCPTLVTYGRLDYSVPVAESVDLLAAVADSTAAGLLTVRVIADTGHGYVRMQEDNPLAPVAPQTLSPEFFQTIADWLRTLGVI
ncbi:MAG: alpha/beta fold hydrolase [Candidatus Krumholzibacteria bacterium]|nr:alpha/beta fold hydrolase [Candidatus Krumholzibacteria bacterium]